MNDRDASSSADGSGVLGAIARRFAEAVRELEVHAVRPSCTVDGKSDSSLALAACADPAAERARRRERVQSAMREDIEALHEQLATGLSRADLEAICATLHELETRSVVVQGSRDLLSRIRHAIASRLRAEAGALALERLLFLLDRRGRAWPCSVSAHPSATEDEVALLEQRSRAEQRAAFLRESFARTAERMQGIVSGWGADYPARGSALWEACVLKGVAAGIRGQLLRDFLAVLARPESAGALLRPVEPAVEKQIAILQEAALGEPHSPAQVQGAVEQALVGLGEAFSASAWEYVSEQLRGAVDVRLVFSARDSRRGPACRAPSR
jgi:hypothetical protein